MPTPTCSELARCVRRPPRVATRRRPATCAELACWLRRPHRVTIAVPTRGSALSSSHYRGANPSSSHYRGSTSSSSHYRGSTSSSCRHRWLNPVGLADWVGLPNPHSCRYRGTNPGGGGLLASLSLAQTGGSSTSKTARNLADVARRTVRLPRVVIRGQPAPCAELARCGRRRPRVTVVVPTPWV